MPFRLLERDVQYELNRVVQEFARLVAGIPATEDAPAHPEIRDVVTSFQRINEILEKGNKAGGITLREKVEIAAEFEKIGEALRRNGSSGQQSKTSR